MTPVVGTAWLGRLFAPWSWSGSNLGGPAANEANLPFAAVYWLVHALRGSPASLKRIWYTALFVGAAVACYLFLRALRVGPAGSTLGALAYVFNAHVVTIGTNPVFLAAMVLLPGLPAVVLTTASGRWTLRRGVLLLGASAPLLGYVYLNPPLVFMIGALLASMPLLVGGLTDGQPHAGRYSPSHSAPAPRARLLLLARADRVAAPDRRDLNARQSVELDLDRGPRHPCQRVLAEQRLGLEVHGIFPYAGDYDKFPLVILKFLLPITAFGFLALARFPEQSG